MASALEPSMLQAACEEAALAIRSHPDDWERRDAAVLSLSAALPPLEAVSSVAGTWDSWKALFRVLKEPFKALLQDLRSELVRDACGTLTQLAMLARDYFRALLRELLDTMLGVLAGGNKVIKRYMDDCLLRIVEHCRYKGCVHSVCDRLATSRSKAQRESCARILRSILWQWHGAVWKDAALVEATGTGLQAGISDASEVVRRISRESFGLLCLKGGECRRRAQKLLEEAEPRIAAQLQDALKQAEESDAQAVDDDASRRLFRNGRRDEDPADGSKVSRGAETPPQERSARDVVSPLGSIAQEMDTVNLHMGDDVVVKSLKQPNVGTVRYIGLTTFATGLWVGVELPHAGGKNNGAVMGEEYFSCPLNHGLFVRPKNVEAWMTEEGARDSLSHSVGDLLPVAPEASRDPPREAPVDSAPASMEGGAGAGGMHRSDAAAVHAPHHRDAQEDAEKQAKVQAATTRTVDFCRTYVQDVLRDMHALLDAAEACGTAPGAPETAVEQLLGLLSDTLARGEPSRRRGEEVLRKASAELVEGGEPGRWQR